MEDYDTGKLYAGAPLEYISVSDYNKAMESQGNKPVSIHNKEAFFISAKEDILDALTAVGDAHKTISVYGHKLKLVNARETSSFLCTSPMPEIMLAVVVPDAVVQSKAPVRTYWNIDLAREAQVSAYQARVEKNITDYAKQTGMQDYRYSGITRDEVRESSLGSGMLFVYIGLYLGIVFLVSSAAVLALQQLSDADDSKSNYDILRKIGTPQRMIDHSILGQIAIYFMLPLSLAIVHAMVGVPVVSGAFSFLFGLQNMWKTNLMTAGIVLLIYGTYFLITYYGYRMAVQGPRHKQKKQ
jgi:putative ABC transport system permease protein